MRIYKENFQLCVSILSSLCDTINPASLQRDGTSAVLIDKKIYYIGGRTKENLTSNDDAFLLDLSSDFAVDEPNFTNFTQVSGLENMASPTWTAACLGKDNTIYIFGGSDGSNSSLPQTNTLYKISRSSDNSLIWTEVSSNQGDTWPSQRDGIVPIIDNLSRIYVWAGRNKNLTLDYTMYIFEVDNWKGYILDNAPIPRSSYSATLLNDGRIIYIGGQNATSASKVFNFMELLIFDTTKLSWTIQPSTSDTSIKNRAAHSALLHLDSISIIIYGGGYYIGGDSPYGDIPESDSVWILNTKTWSWSQPSIPSLSYINVTKGHTAVMYNGYMMIALVMDVTNLSSLAWDPTYKVRLPSTTTTTGPTNTQSTNASTDGTTGKNLGLILGIVIGGILLVIAVLMIFFICRRRRSESSATPYPVTPATNGRHSEYSNNEPVSVTTNGRHSEYSAHSNNEPVSVTTSGRHSEYSAHSTNEPVSAIFSTVNTTGFPAQVQNTNPYNFYPNPAYMYQQYPQQYLYNRQ
ncbi:14085_t:CDS:2 [Ambispora leptoticha]|uniref:14085_t:CDS:1 n=1 Tax=Ambispora leptoticha TaxID=144679 RepID=A0A9N8ZQV3_9GLOM|nr:14085_t:CDS:2 [Ambispora leptoticha]